MRTLEEYVAMIPAAPPADIDRYLDALGRKPLAITSYRCISRDDAESRLDCEDFRADLRPSATIRPAALWCSECESWYLAEYVPAYGVPCSQNLTYQNNSGVQVVNVEQDTIDKKRNGETMVCPLCGAQTQLRNVQELRYGRAAQDFIVVPTVAENCLVLTQWCIERHMYEGYRHTERNAINAFVVDGRRIIKLAHYQYNAMAGSWRKLGTWVQRAKLVDDIGCPKMYAANLPDLGGTGAENAKLWEYMEQSNAAKTFYPVAYLRLYFKHPNVENLVTAGLGNLVGDGIDGEMESQRRADAKMTELNQKERDEAIKAAQKARAELEEAKRAAAVAEQARAKELDQARHQAEETAARLNMAADESAVRFGLLFDQLQDTAGKIFDLVDTLQQGGLTEKAEKIQTALHKALLALADEAEDVQK